MKSKIMPILINSVVLLSVIGLPVLISQSQTIQPADAIDVTPVVEGRNSTVVASKGLVNESDSMRSPASTFPMTSRQSISTLWKIQSLIASNLGRQILEPIGDLETTRFDEGSVQPLIASYGVDVIHATVLADGAVAQSIDA